MITDFAIQIGSGTVIAPAGAGCLSPRRGAELRERLRLLDAARRSAAVEIREYAILGSSVSTAKAVDHG